MPEGKSTTWIAALAVVAIAAFAWAVLRRDPVTRSPARAAAFLSATNPGRLTDEPIHPIAPPTDLDTGIVSLGRDLFFDPRLSGDGTISCATCHDPQRGGTDQLARSIGVRGARGRINAPTVFNAALNFRQFWNGRAATLEEQVGGPIVDSLEMGARWPIVLAALRAVPSYRERFQQMPGGVTEANVRTAIATYERSLITPSRFDRYLSGEANAITTQEREGYEIFKEYGCASCHQGAGVGGNMYQAFGVMADYFADRGNLTPADDGRYGVTGDPADLHVFKVPSLRNVARTPPYFHDGSATTLEDAIRVMGRYQLGRTLTPDEVAKLAAFLEALNGDVPSHALAPAHGPSASR